MNKSIRYKTAKRATIVNASINTLLAILKIVLGLFGHSQALVADGIHSFSDLITDALVLFAAKMGDQHPDKEHPYGHRRIETVTTIIIALVLLGVAIGIGYDTLSHIISGVITEKPDLFVVIVAVISILANEFLYHYTMRQGNKVDSDLLRSNAWHNRSDSLVSIVVLVSVIGAMMGAHYLDAIGALIIALLILKMSFKMIWKSIMELIDTGVEEKLIEEITNYIGQISGVISIHQLRTRSHGSHIFLDVHIEVDPKISVSEGHYISEQVNHKLVNDFEKIIDVTVHIDPEDDEQFALSKDLPTRQTILAALKQHWQTLPSYQYIKKITLHYLNGKVTVEVYLPTDKATDKPSDYQQRITDINYISGVDVYYS